MSRFARLNSGPVRTWAPSASPFRVEYPPELLRELRMTNNGVDAFGMLYGVRHDQTIRLVSTRGRAGLNPLGIFAARVRGEVFLTEEDLERFEKADACVALVISGETGGFFVRDGDGSIEAVRSYEEFSVHGPTPVSKVAKRRPKWGWSLLLLPLLGLIPRHPPPLAVTLREDSGQLRISWNVPVKATLEILDGGARTALAIAPGLSTVTYARRSEDVTVGIGSAQARFVGPPLPPTLIERERAEVRALESRIVLLRSARAAGQAKIVALKRRLQ
ncbi:MAG: hypothetical protein ABSF12_24140 [Bryobacteraceae bacterium]